MEKIRTKRSLTNEESYEDNLKIRKKKNINSDQDNSNNRNFDPLIANTLQNVKTHELRQSDEIPFHKPHKKFLEEKEKNEFPGIFNGSFDLQENEKVEHSISMTEQEGKVEDYSSSGIVSWPKTVSIHVRPKGKVLDDQDDNESQKRHPPKIVDQRELIDKLRTDSSAEFYYMIYAVERSSEFFTPYAFKNLEKNRILINSFYGRVVPYEEISKSYMTISANGVIKYSPGEMTFTPIEIWEREYIDYLKLMKFKTFLNFRIWKAFYVWRKSISWRKYNTARDYLSENLFISHLILSKTLLEVKAMCTQFLHVSFVDTRVFEKLPLFLFVEIQFTKLEDIRGKLDKFRDVATKLVKDACLKTLLEAGYTPDDSNITIDQTEFGKLGRFAGTKFKMPKDGILKMSHIEQARKREKCYRLSCFIHLIDYLQANMLQNLMHNTYKALLDTLQENVNYSLSDDEEEFESKSNLKEKQRCPYFLVDLVIFLEFGITLDPSEEIFWHVITTIQSMWEENLFEIKPFLSDPFFDIFTRPMINHKIEERISGEPPEILTILKEDYHMNDLKGKFENILKENFQAVKEFIRTFNHIETFFTEDINFNEAIMKENAECSIFREWCVRYQNEIVAISDVHEEEFLGIFFIKLERFKNLALPAPTQKWIVLEKVIPCLGKARVDVLLNEANEAISYLETNPVTTDDYVAYINFVDQAQHKVDKMETELEYVKEIYNIMEEYQIPVPAMDAANYLGISVQFATLHSAVKKKLEDRGKLIAKFNAQIQKDIDAVIHKISDINDEATQSWLLDADSNVEGCLETLNDLSQRLVECAELTSEYRSHQKGFKVEMTRFDILDHVTNEVKLRSLLWESVISWSKTLEEWYQADFNTLNVEEITNYTTRSLKNIIQFEKGLPENNVLPNFKEKVENFKDKLSIIVHLRNPNLQPRHWMKIEDLLNYKFKPDEILTLELLECLGAFDYPNELLEIASSASSEAGLEIMLEKVEDTWKTLEFIVLPYKEIKDVHYLGSIEEIQLALDDSNINIQTIAASRHVACIKSEVDDWIKQLDLVSRTLEAWQYCQQQWMYLEAIFSAPDIKRQLPIEAKLFAVVDRSWKEIMRKTAKMSLAMETCTQPGLLERFIENNNNLDQILKCLEAYLETKRIAFPRFFFLSNDELLEILAQTRNPHAVQRHLQKCFDAIYRLEFGTASQGREEILTTDIIAMLSPEGERVVLQKGLKARGNVEDWLGNVEQAMFAALKREMKKGIIDLEEKGRRTFIESFPSQNVLTVSQIFWARDVHIILESGDVNLMQNFEAKSFEDLNELAGLVRGELPRLIREVIINLITVYVHARDIISVLVENKIQSSSSFDWMKNLRYYWDEESDSCLARMSNAEYLYGYEYLGAQRRLVITPLTDKCYLCLMGALQLDLGGAPAGPAGTGKTETTKDLAKALAVQCVVFNCSEGLDYRMMGRFFSGLATSGAWCCFDEFNRIDIEVLSVIAQQLITIRNAKVIRAKEFIFEGRMIKLVMSCATFVTMNPGYAGRTELPDNLKSLFRPFAMMVPDYKLIAEVTLYSEGFESSKPLSTKMTLMYTLCSEQLSQQDHYDFGMRAVKSVLVMAGSLKRENPEKLEDVVLLRALRDSNLPKFLADDTELFLGILGDLFPGIIIPDEDYGIFQETAEKIMKDAGFQPESCSIIKTIQLHETMLVRHGVMLVGPTGSGKTTVLQTLKDTYTRLYEMNVPKSCYQKVHTYVLNPKAVTIGELYGSVDTMSNEWHDGLIGAIIRHACSFTTEEHQWVVCDGPVDAIWIENMNTVLDDNKMLCLANSERIKFTPYVHMLFEVMDLSQASPATVSRCGMVYFDPADLKWLPYARSWLQKIPEDDLNQSLRQEIMYLLETYVEDGLRFLKKNCNQTISQVDIGKVNMLCALVESIILEPNAIDKSAEMENVRIFLTQSFIISYIWAIGGNLVDSSRQAFELFVKNQFYNNPHSRLPPSEDLWNLCMNTKSQTLEIWTKLMPSFSYDKAMPFFEILVPTVDTVRFGYLMEKLLNVNKAVLFTGGTGVGKSVIAKVVLRTLQNSGLWVPVVMNFSAQTSSGRIQEILELKLEKRKRTVLGAPFGKRICIFVDDVNMPKLDSYGSQPPIELLRQFLDFGGIYDRDKHFWKSIEDVVLSCACAPPGGGRNPLTPRFIRHFGMLAIPAPSESSLKDIFRSIMKGFLQEFLQPVMEIGDKIVSATVEIYNRIAIDLLPTPEKSHYIFNLRDLSKCIQGMLQADPSIVIGVKQMLRLFYHECLRVFHDRLINIEDKSYFYHLLTDTCSRTFGDEVIRLPEDKVVRQPPLLLFGDFMSFGASKEQRFYDEITDLTKAINVLQDYLDDYCLVTSKEMNLIFFADAVEHLCRLARILRSERGNGLLVGVGGMGKQSLTKLASHMNGYRCMQIEVTRGYDMNSWHEDLRRFYFKPGAFAEDVTFLFTDTQIVLEEFLEDINNTLNSGEVPNLFEADELEKAIIATRPAAKEAGIKESDRDGIYDYFICRVRNHLHLMLCMSPVGNSFRHRCRMFPSLVNCCTIDWFTKWPKEALLSVAKKTIESIANHDENKLSALSSICVLMHESVEEMTVKFFNEMRRRYYTTPSSYLALLKLFLVTLKKKIKNTLTLKSKIANGLNKLKETNETVAMMKEQLIILAPQLKTSSEEVSKLMQILAKQQIELDKVKTIVSADEAIVKVKAEETGALEAEARKDLEAAMPALEEAQKALESLNKNDINEIKVFNSPPPLVRYVMEAVNLLLGEKLDWTTARVVLGDLHFLDRLIEYPKDNISDKLLKKLQDYINNPNFLPHIVAKQSKVCKSICIWVRAIDGYAKLFRIVHPKRLKLQAAEKELRSIMDVLEQKQQQLREVENKINKLRREYEEAVNNLKSLEFNIQLSEARLNRSGRLTSALADEEIRWQENMKDFDRKMENFMGDTLVAAGALAYLGAFTSEYRIELLTKWLKTCEEQKIVTTANFNLIAVLADPYEIRLWNSFGLPRDQVSTENAIFVTQAEKWSLMIDPQEQANRWIRNMEQQNHLKICKLTDGNLMRFMESCIRIGSPILLEDVGEILDPSLEPVLLKQTFVQGGRKLIRLGESDIEYDDNFRLYITTKMANPHYLPEICIKVTIVNFTVTPSGLEEQLLSDVVRLEKPELEKLRNELIAKINEDKNQLQNIEDKILTLLFSSGDNILDNEELIETLNNSKETSAIIITRLIETEATEEKISIIREKYRSAATRGSVLYFVVADLAEIDPMYQFSLKYFNQIFNNVIEVSEKSENLENRLKTLYDEITLAIYTNVSRGLFEKHKLVFSLMLNISIFLNSQIISYSQWDFLLRGSGQFKTSKKPDYPTLTETMWTSVNFLANHFKAFENIMADVFKRISLSIEYFHEEINVIPDNNKKSEFDWDEILSDMEKLMLIKALKEEKLIFALTAYVKKNLGQKFVESPMISLELLYPDTLKTIPLVFILSTGSDPFSTFQRFASKMGFNDKYQSISLGQGQGPIAENLLRKGIEIGSWVFLQNCHLATSWMLSMEKLIIEIIQDSEGVHENFRLFLSSMPSKSFPVSVLQNSVKVTNEPPKGLKANIKRAFFDLTEDFFENNPLELNWRKMIFGICFFHAIIQERKKFGPLGWNIHYEFNNNDRECCLLNLKMFCKQKTIPWAALIYITGEITYGGRITDNWDLRCLKTILNDFFSPKILEADYVYSTSGTYFCPNLITLHEYREFIENFPIIEDPEIFGMHENANITFQLQETKTVLNTIMEVQPKIDIGEKGKSTSDIAYESANMIMERIRREIDSDDCHPNHLKKDFAGRLPSLTTVLLHEVDRYNKLLSKIHSTMENLQRAIKGLVVMSAELEAVFIALINNQVPEVWHKVNMYPSLKSLGSWIRDLELRIDFIQTWLKNSKPISFWISGLSFPQGFITGVLQTHARKYNIPIDHLKLDFKATKILLHQEDIETVHRRENKETASAYQSLQEPSDGVFIHGLFIDAGRWDFQSMILVDANKGEMNPSLPVLHILPVLSLPDNDPRYVCPLYKTSIRAGVLSTTGHSTNFVLAILLPSAHKQSYWILKGTALLIQVTN